jgi:hypothetical protein
MAIDFNDPVTWCSGDVYKAPSFNARAYQRKLDKIAGTRRGRPVVRLIWAGDKNCFSKFYDDWDDHGLGIHSEIRAKYKYAVIRVPGTADSFDVPPPRWIFEERHEPEQYAASWEQARWVYVTKGDGTEDKRRVERRPPPPNEYYDHLWTVAKHDDYCCQTAQMNKKVCWGLYRQPDERDLDVIRRAIQDRDKDAEQSPYEQLNEKSLAAADKDASDFVSKTKEERKQKTKEFVDDNALALISMFTGADLSDKTKKFSVPSKYKQTQAGIIIPKGEI